MGELRGHSEQHFDDVHQGADADEDRCEIALLKGEHHDHDACEDDWCTENECNDEVAILAVEGDRPVDEGGQEEEGARNPCDRHQELKHPASGDDC